VGELPLPTLDALTRPFWEGCKEQRLLVQQCPETNRLIFPPQYRSPWAPLLKPLWTQVSGRGTLWSAAQPHPPLVEPFASLAPYNIVVVSLEDDPRVRMVGNLVAEAGGGINALSWERLRPGLLLEVEFQPVTQNTGSADETWWFPRWRIIDDA